MISEVISHRIFGLVKKCYRVENNWNRGDLLIVMVCVWGSVSNCWCPVVNVLSLANRRLLVSGWWTFSEKDQRLNIVDLLDLCSSHSTLLLLGETSLRQYINEWVCAYPLTQQFYIWECSPGNNQRIWQNVYRNIYHGITSWQGKLFMSPG